MEVSKKNKEKTFSKSRTRTKKICSLSENFFTPTFLFLFQKKTNKRTAISFHRSSNLFTETTSKLLLPEPPVFLLAHKKQKTITPL